MLEQLISSSELLKSLQKEGVNIQISENYNLDITKKYAIQITADTIELLEKACINLYNAISGENKSFYGKAPAFTNFIDRIQGNAENKLNKAKELLEQKIKDNGLDNTSFFLDDIVINKKSTMINDNEIKEKEAENIKKSFPVYNPEGNLIFTLTRLSADNKGASGELEAGKGVKDEN